jgi:hypothetical protein
MNIYTSGDTVRVSAIFASTAGVLGDPTQVVFTWGQPDGVTGSAVYGTGTALVREKTGCYYYDTALGAPGTLHYRWQSSGAFPGMEEDYMTIKHPAF